MDQSKVAQYLANYVYDPALFVKEQFSVDPYDWQKDCWRLLLDKHFLAIVSGNGQGKTGFLAFTILWFLITRPQSIIPCVGVNEDQLSSTLWLELQRWIRVSPLVSSLVDWTAERVTVRGYPEWSAVARTAKVDKKEMKTSIQGTHAQYLLFVVDEASGVPDPVIDSLQSNATLESNYGLLCSNGTRDSGFFYDCFQNPDGTWATRQVTDKEKGAQTEQFRRQMLRKYRGEDTNGYRIRVKGEFPRSDDRSLVPSIAYKAVQVRDYMYNAADTPIVVSIDPAGESVEADSSTIGVRAGNYILSIISFSQLDTLALFNQAKDIIDRYGASEVCIDSIGIGAGTADLLLDHYHRQVPEKGVTVYKINVGSSPYNNQMYLNLRAELYCTGAEAIKLDKIKICDDLPTLYRDLTELKLEYGTRNKRKIMSKETFRQLHEGESTDFGDAFALLFRGDAERLAEGWEREESSRYDSNSALVIADHCSQLRKNNLLTGGSRSRLLGQNFSFI